MDIKKIDPRLLNAIYESVGLPSKPCDLTKVKAITKWPDVGLWRDGNRVGDWLEIEAGAFDILGELPNLHTLIFPWGFRHKDYAFLANCKKLKKLDVGLTDFQDCSLLTLLPNLRYVSLPQEKQLCHTEVLSTLKAKTPFTPYLAEEHNPVQPAQPAAPKARFESYEGDLPLEALLEGIKARTKVPAYRLRVQRGKVPGLTDSKFGGLPYWDPSRPYPLDGSGKPMQLLAQINFEAEDMDPPFPKTGLLQFFAARDEMYGCNFADSPDQKNYQVVYHAQVDKSVTPEQVSALGAPGLGESCTQTPLEEILAIHAERADSFANDRSFVFERAVRETVLDVMGVDMGDQLSYEFLDEEAYDELFEALMETDDGCLNGGHWMLGWPSFTQDDPRTEDSPFDTLLLQIDSMEDEGRSYSILWGDCGVANFFIARTDLERLDFSRVLYNWDCC